MIQRFTCIICCFYGMLSALFALDFSAFNRNHDASWSQFEHARVCYEQREYGDALRLVLDASDLRSQESAAAAAILKTASRTQALKRIGDDLTRSLEKLEERGDTAAVAVIREVFVIYDVVYFNNSLQNLITWLEGYRVYPEALFLQGQIHQAEGEYLLAERFYLESWKNAEYFDIKEDVYPVLYALADLARYRDLPKEQEKYLMLILEHDPLCPFNAAGKQAAVLTQMRKILIDREHAPQTPRDGVDKRTFDKFFLLYRHDSWFSLKAYQNLAEYYNSIGNIDRAFDCGMLAASIIMTNLNRSLSVREVAWEYTKPEAVFAAIRRHPDIVQWTKDNYVWKTLYQFCRIVSSAGNNTAAQDFLTKTAPYCDDPEWRVFYRTTIE